MGALFIVLLLLQLKYSKKARMWTKSIGCLTVYITSVLGLVGTVSTLAIKYKLGEAVEKVNKQPLTLPLAFPGKEEEEK